MTRWYRAYEGTVTDAKLGEVALAAECSRSVAIAAWHCLLENACTLNDGGRFNTTPRRIAVILGETPAVIEKVIAELRALGMLDGDQINAWSRRQFESDSSTERSRKHREAKRGQGVTLRNAGATLQGRSATPPETESEKETEDSIASKVDSLGSARASDGDGAAGEAVAPQPEAADAIDPVAEAYLGRVIKAAGWSGYPPDWPLIDAWLALGVDFDQVILPCVQRVRAKAQARGQALPMRMSYVDKALREVVAAQNAEAAAKAREQQELDAAVAKRVREADETWAKHEAFFARVMAWRCRNGPNIHPRDDPEYDFEGDEYGRALQVIGEWRIQEDDVLYENRTPWSVAYWKRAEERIAALRAAGQTPGGGQGASTKESDWQDRQYQERRRVLRAV